MAYFFVGLDFKGLNCRDADGESSGAESLTFRLLAQSGFAGRQLIWVKDPSELDRSFGSDFQKI